VIQFQNARKLILKRQTLTRTLSSGKYDTTRWRNTMSDLSKDLSAEISTHGLAPLNELERHTTGSVSGHSLMLHESSRLFKFYCGDFEKV